MQHNFKLFVMIITFQLNAELLRSAELAYYGNQISNTASGQSRPQRRGLFILRDFQIDQPGLLAGFRGFFVEKNIPIRLQIWSMDTTEKFYAYYQLKLEVRVKSPATGCQNIILNPEDFYDVSKGDLMGILFEEERSPSPISSQFQQNANYPVYGYPGFVHQLPSPGESLRFDTSIGNPKKWAVGLLIDTTSALKTLAEVKQQVLIEYPDCSIQFPVKSNETTPTVIPTENPSTSGPWYPTNLTGTITVGNPLTNRTRILSSNAKRSFVLEHMQVNNGIILAFQVFIKRRTGKAIRLQMWREVRRLPGAKFYALIGEKRWVPPSEGHHVVTLSERERFNVTQADRVGFTNEGDVGQIAYAFTHDPSHRVYFRPVESVYYTNIGEIRRFDSFSLPYVYSIAVTYDTNYRASTLSKTGKIGAKGQKGADGPRGFAGDPGDIGPEGSMGVKGPKGLTGQLGPPGQDGPDGPSGSKGDDGDQGSPGIIGSRGDIGAKGDQGARGPAGPRGEKGPSGTRGSSPSAPPPQGPLGPKGLKGDTGDRGPTGVTGSAGIRGPQGPPGQYALARNCSGEESQSLQCSQLQQCYSNSVLPNTLDQPSLVNLPPGATNSNPKCHCKPGYRLSTVDQTCQDINECDLPEVANGGCEDDCKNTIGSYECSCRPGYRLSSNQLNCNDVNECLSASSNNCPKDSQCVNVAGSYKCLGVIPYDPRTDKKSSEGDKPQKTAAFFKDLRTRNWVIGFIIWLIILTVFIILLIVCACMRRSAIYSKHSTGSPDHVAAADSIANSNSRPNHYLTFSNEPMRAEETVETVY